MFPLHHEDVEIDAMSKGMDVIPAPTINGSGVPSIQSVGRWMGIIVSVENGTPGTGLIARAKLNGRSSGSDLFSHYLQESVFSSTGVISPRLAGETLVEQTRESMGLPSNSSHDVDAMDFSLGVRHHAPAPANLADPLFPLPQTERFFFSVTPSSATALNQSNSGFLSNSGTVSPADIYEILWSGTGWTEPSVYKSWDTLRNGLNASPNEEDIDGLSVDHSRGTVVFSTQVETSRSQLLLHFGGVSAPMEGQIEGSVVVNLGGDDTTNIDAICILDPKESQNSFYFGTPRTVADVPFLDSHAGLSVTRSSLTDSAGYISNVLHLQYSGGGEPSGSSRFVCFFGSLNYDPDIAWSSQVQDQWQVLGISYSDSSVPGSMIDHTVTAPPTPGGVTLAVTAIEFDFWTLGTMSSSWVSEIRIP